MKFTFKKFLIKALILIAALFIAVTIYTNKTTQHKPVQIIQSTESVSSSEYIINKELILGKLHSKSQIVSVEQKLNDTFTHIEETWLGERQTNLIIKGSYKMGLNSDDIEVKHIDDVSGTIYIKLPDPILISLELPYNYIEFSKNGWWRLSLNEEEKINFYKSAEKSIRNHLSSDKEIHRMANLYNQDVVRGLLKDIVGVKSVVFE